MVKDSREQKRSIEGIEKVANVKKRIIPLTEFDALFNSKSVLRLVRDKSAKSYGTTKDSKEIYHAMKQTEKEVKDALRQGLAVPKKRVRLVIRVREMCEKFHRKNAESMFRQGHNVDDQIANLITHKYFLEKLKTAIENADSTITYGTPHYENLIKQYKAY